jgi:extradiol dioxygenase family protein
MSIASRYANLFQMSYITRDLDAAMAHAREHMGVEHFDTTEAKVEVLCFGELRPLHIRAAFANIGRNQFEIIEPVSGAIEIYTDEVDLSKHILNFHHIAIAVRGTIDDWRALLAEVRASGDAFAYLMPAEPGDDDKLCFCYVDTRHRIGHYTEYLWVDEAIKPVPAMPDLDA